MSNIKRGDRYQFEDGNYIEVIQIKTAEYQNEVTEMVTYHISGPRSLPRKLVMEINQFISNFGHLFEDNSNKS
jgi:hypothetical protein